MANATQTASNVDGNVKTTATYSANTYGIPYAILTGDVTGTFDFLINELPQKLDDVLKELDLAASATDAFNFDGVNTLEQAQQEIIQDVTNIKNGLTSLHATFLQDIANVNTEIEENFGWAKIAKIREESTKTETIQTETPPSN